MAEDDDDTYKAESLNYVAARRDSGRPQWAWRKVTVAVDSGAAENVMPRSMFPEISIEETERSMNGKGFKGPGGEPIKNHGCQVMSVRTPEGFVRKSTWQVADVRKPLVSVSHIIQAGNDVFIGKDEAYIFNRRKKEKTVLRKENNVYVLDLFVKVPVGGDLPTSYEPMEVDTLNQVMSQQSQPFPPPPAHAEPRRTRQGQQSLAKALGKSDFPRPAP